MLVLQHTMVGRDMRGVAICGPLLPQHEELPHDHRLVLGVPHESVRLGKFPEGADKIPTSMCHWRISSVLMRFTSEHLNAHMAAA